VCESACVRERERSGEVKECLCVSERARMRVCVRHRGRTCSAYACVCASSRAHLQRVCVCVCVIEGAPAAQRGALIASWHART